MNGKHSFRTCPRQRKCTIEGCRSTHNTLLHGAERVFPVSTEKQSNVATLTNVNSTKTSSNTVENAKSMGTASSSGLTSITDVKGLLQVLEVDLLSPSDVRTRALVLCDTACSHSWISSELASRLQLKGTPLKLTVNGINTQETITTESVQVTVQPIGEDTCSPFDLLPYVKTNLRVGSDIIDNTAIQEKYPHLSVLPNKTYDYANVEMILGQDAYHAIRPIEYFETESKSSPVAVRLPLGWVLSGPLPYSSGLVSTCFKAVAKQDSELATQIKSWYDMESYGAVKQVDPRSASDHRATATLEQSTVHNEGRYHVGMLWSSDEVKLPNNFFSAMVQFKSLEKRLGKDPVLYKRYAQTIQDNLDKGYVIKVESRDDKHCAGREWYLPHHPVVNPNQPEKVRRVLNGASKFRGISLNSVLLTGPDLLQRLIHTLMRFRQHQFAVSADIEGMFLQVGVLPAEQSVLRFLWREDPSRNIEVYQYTRHIFGAKDSPTCANYALLRTARDNNSDVPEAAQAVSQKFYMDDYLDSMESPIIVQKKSRDLIELLNRGGFKLTKFISNVPGLLEELEDKSVEQAPKEIGASKEESSSHVLGLKRDHVNDTLVVSRGTICDASKAVTQRLVVSLVSKIFDPIGLVSLFTVKARLLLKDVWRFHGQSWDDVLPKEMIERFESWSAE